MKADEHVKDEIAEKYNSKARDIEDKEWIVVRGVPRYPTKQSSYYFVDRKLRHAFEMTHATPDMYALEIGCSLGEMTGTLAKTFRKMSAIDISPLSIELAGRRLKEFGIDNIDFSIDDAEILSTQPDNTYDVVYSFSAIRYCSDVQKAIEAAYAKLKPGGTVLIDFPNRLSPWHVIMKKSLGIVNHVNDHLFTRPVLEQMFTKAGFTNIKMRNILFNPRSMPSKAIPVFKLANPILEALPLFNRLSGVIMVAAKKPE